MKIKTAVIPAGGYGSRMEPITKAVPKPMLPIIRKPVIHHIVKECVDSDIKKIIIVTGFRGEIIQNYFSADSEYDRRSYGPKSYFQDLEIEFISQNIPLGLADAVRCAEKKIEGGSFAVLLGDDIFRGLRPGIAQLCESYENGHLIGAISVSAEAMSNYGVLVPKDPYSKVFRVSEILEKPKNIIENGIAVAGRYIFESSIFDKLSISFSKRGIESNLTDALNLAVSEEKNVKGIKMDGRRYDVGNEQEYIETIMSAVREGWY
jgi:UDP-glucose pyrophosphorylase